MLKKQLRKLMPHVSIVLSILMLAFFILDIFNPGMNFVGNDVFKILLLLYSITTMITAGLLISRTVKRKSGGK